MASLPPAVRNGILDRLGDDLGHAPEELGADQEVAFERRLERDPRLPAESVDAGHAPSGRSDLALLLQVHAVSLRRSAVVAGVGWYGYFTVPFSYCSPRRLLRLVWHARGTWNSGVRSTAGLALGGHSRISTGERRRMLFAARRDLCDNSSDSAWQ